MVFKAKPKSVKTYEKMTKRELINHEAYWHNRAQAMGDKGNKKGKRLAYDEAYKIGKIQRKKKW